MGRWRAYSHIAVILMCSENIPATYHEKVEIPPGQTRVNDHGRGDQRCQKCANRVARVHDPLHGVGIVHDTDPGAETGIGQAVAEPGNGVDHHKERERRMGGQDSVGNDVADWCHDCNAALTEFGMDGCIGEGGYRVAGEGGQKNQRDNGVIKVVV